MIPLPYMIGFLFCFAVAHAGRVMRQHPHAGAKLFFWAPDFAAYYFRSTGMFFLTLGFAGMLFYAVLTLLAALPARSI